MSNDNDHAAPRTRLLPSYAYGPIRQPVNRSIIWFVVGLFVGMSGTLIGTLIGTGVFFLWQ